MTYHLKKKHYESIFIEVDKALFNTNRNTILGEIYKPPSSNLKTFNIEMERLLVKIKKEKKYAFLMGDYNVNTILETHNNPKSVQDFINMFSSYYYHKLINLPTRQRNLSFSLLDNIYTNIPDCYNTCTSGVLKFLTQSDHYPIFTIRNKIEPPKPKAEITKRKHSSKNIALFRKQIKRSDWGSLYSNENIEAAFSIFIKTIVSTFQKCFPIEIIRLNHKNRNPWINQTLKDDIKKR